MIKFVTANTGGVDSKRKRRACESCRKRKRRCHHDDELVDPSDTISSTPDANNSPTSISIPTSTHPRRVHSVAHINETQLENWVATSQRSSENVANRPGLAQPGTSNQAVESSRPSGTNAEDRQALDSRFIGALNPEGVFLAATSPENLRGASTGGDVGIWLAEKLSRSDHFGEELTTPLPSSLLYGFNTSVQKVFSSLLGQESLSAMPTPEHRDALCALYFRKIHPIFPIIDESGYQNLPEVSPARILLTQGLCLAASMDFNSRPHLIYTEGTNPTPFVDFGKRILTAMRVAIEIGLVSDRIVLIQALALMSFFIDSREGSETSSLMVGRAVQLVHSLGLHMRGREDQPHNEYAERIFCCIWVLDRLNAALHGRPVMMHDRDIGRSLQDTFAAQLPSFRLMCHVVELLDNVIRLYRPGIGDEEVLSHVPLFEDLVVGCKATQIPFSILATIEVLYHGVAMLSCRSSSGNNVDPSQTAAKMRQAWSSERLTAMMSHDSHEQLVLLPFIPYSVSLSLSVAYRDMRRCKIQMHRVRAWNILEANCRTLETLGEIFWSANIMAEMGNKTLTELERVYAHVTDPDAHKNQRRQGISDSQDKGPAPNEFSISRRPSVFDLNFGADYDFDSLLGTEIPGPDPFEMFDPNIDLDAIDACLEQNLNPGIPMSLY